MRGPNGRLFIRVVLVSVVALAALAGSVWSETPLDPQSLVGVWSGTRINKHGGGAAGQYELTIERVNGDKIYMQVVIDGRETFETVGTLNGNRLTFSKQNPTELLIEGNQMKGTTQGSTRAAPRAVTLIKTK